MNLSDRINGFVKLGEEFNLLLEGRAKTQAGTKLVELLPDLFFRNGWYSEKNVRHRLLLIAGGLKKELLEQWLSGYSFPVSIEPKNVGVILAGNIPLVGFDDFRCVLISGNIFSGKIPKDDKFLLPLVAAILIEIEPRFESQIVFIEDQFRGVDAIIATGSANSSRYFEHYFSRYPHVIRGNRNGVAVLTGTETKQDLALLGEDIFRYFGLGCRSVTKLFVPKDYNFNEFFESIFNWGEEVLNNNKYMNNYDYHKTLYLLSSIPLLDNNFILLKEDKALSSPPGVVFYEYYDSMAALSKKMDADASHIQCVISASNELLGALPFGQSQHTTPSDYADGVDVIKFLVSLSERE